VTIETIHWHTLHPRFLGRASNVIDLGANIGQFAQAVTERFGCNCVALEPAPEPFGIIPDAANILKMQAAVGAASGTMLFHLASQSNASSLVRKVSPHTHTIDVGVFSLADLIDHLAWSRIDLLKVDIEGAEIDMFAACPDEILQRIAQITIEFHDFCGMTPAQNVAKTLARFRELGFFSVRMSRIGHQDTWLINRRLLAISTAELFSIRYLVRNWMGFKRMASRQFRR
jgi:FkbM family methyltransferase